MAICQDSKYFVTFFKSVGCLLLIISSNCLMTELLVCGPIYNVAYYCLNPSVV